MYISGPINNEILARRSWVKYKVIIDASKLMVEINSGSKVFVLI